MRFSRKSSEYRIGRNSSHSLLDESGRLAKRADRRYSRQAKELTGGGEACSGVLIIDFWTFELRVSRHAKFWIFCRCRQSPIKNCKKFSKLLKLSIRALNLYTMSYMLENFPQVSPRYFFSKPKIFRQFR